MDADDACPLEPERYNGFQDEDGWNPDNLDACPTAITMV